MSSGVRELYNKVTFLLNCKTPPIIGGGCYLPIIIEEAGVSLLLIFYFKITILELWLRMTIENNNQKDLYAPLINEK